MNHYDLIIRDYLEEQKSVSFEKIGTLVVADKSTTEGQQGVPGSLLFTYNKKALTSPALVDYIAQRLTKNKGLIQSDLESYIELMRQFINIGKPYEMDGVGVFKLAKTNEYEFTAYDLTENKEEQKNIKRQNSGNHSAAAYKNNNRTALMFFAVLIVVVVLGAIGWGTYKLLLPGNKTENIIDTSAVTTILPVDTTANTNIILSADTLLNKKTDTADYKFIYETTSLASRAYLRTAQLKKFGKPAEIDSTGADTAKVYQLYLKMRLNFADTARAKDSLQKSLQRSIKIVAIK